VVGLKSLKSLARLVDFDRKELIELAESASDSVQWLQLIDLSCPDKKPREVLNVRGKLRKVQHRLLRRLFERCLKPADCSHGGICGRSIKTNAAAHLDCSYLYTTDVSKFYPSIHRRRVYRLFDREECSPDVSRVLTMLCTIEDHLALGLITSPILADQMFNDVDIRLFELAVSAGLIYTRYVDDVTLSGPFDFSQSGIPDAVDRIISEHGFQIQRKKDLMGPVNDPLLSVTKLRINRGKLDVRSEYIEALTKQLEGHRYLGRDEEFSGTYATRSQLFGRVRFVCWVNPGRKLSLIRAFNSVDWKSAERNASQRGLVAVRKILVPKPPVC
jgi:RNA-directed DNA polymerase